MRIGRLPKGLRYLIWGLILVYVLFGCYWLANKIFGENYLNISLAPELVSAFIGLLGVFVGVLLTNFYNNRKEKIEFKRNLISEFINIKYDTIIHLNRFLESKSKNQIENIVELKILNSKIENQIIAYSIKVLGSIENIWIRAAISRFVSGYRLITEQIFNNESVDKLKIKSGAIWFENQSDDLILLLMKEGKIPTKIDPTFVFVGWKRITQMEKQKLNFEIESPPWEPHIFYNKNISDNEELLEKIRAGLFEKIKNIKCEDHGYAPHLACEKLNGGYFSNIEIHGCCENMIERTSNILGVTKKNN